jgi:hypothetical protein
MQEASNSREYLNIRKSIITDQKRSARRRYSLRSKPDGTYVCKGNELLNVCKLDDEMPYVYLEEFRGTITQSVQPVQSTINHVAPFDRARAYVGSYQTPHLFFSPDRLKSLSQIELQRG